MAHGDFERSLVVPRERVLVWNTITDVKRVASWISIVGSVLEEERLSRYSAVLEDRLGPFRLKANLNISVVDVEEGRRLGARAQGIDRQLKSRLSIEGLLSLVETDDGTRLNLRASYDVTGKVASLGDSVIRRKAAKIVDEFFQNADEALGSGRGREHH